MSPCGHGYIWTPLLDGESSICVLALRSPTATRKLSRSYPMTYSYHYCRSLPGT
jgi:hypothetical protein